MMLKEEVWNSYSFATLCAFALKVFGDDLSIWMGIRHNRKTLCSTSFSRETKSMSWLAIAGIALGVLLLLVLIYDLTQKKHAILHNFPIIGHFRYLLESIGPELRQYIVTSNNEERPFSRDERTWVYASSKKENNYFGFGTDNDMETQPNYLIINQSMFPLPDPLPGDEDYDPLHLIPCAKVMGEHRGRAKAFRPSSVINISGMSYGSLSAPAIEALNRGSKIAQCLHNTGEGGVSPHHKHGGELIWQIGTAYFGCRDEHGRFSMSKFQDVVAANPIKAIEVKLSQGAKPGRGGCCPPSKSPRKSPKFAASRWAKTAPAPPRMANFPMWMACWISSRNWPMPPVCPWA